MQFKRLLVIIDPTRDDQPALSRARVIASQMGSEVRLYACIHQDTAGPRWPGSETEALEGCRSWMETLAEPLRDAGAQVSIAADWAEDWYQGCVRAATDYEADAVLKSSFRHSVSQRVLKRSSDWTLIRQCDCPVLLVKDGARINPRKVLAAVDIGATEGPRAKANEKILSFSRATMESDSAEVHFVCAYRELSEAPDRNRLVREWDISQDRIHVRMGDPDDVIVDLAARLEVGLLVIGNSGRSGLAAMVNNNTVERVLDKLDCDLLAVS